MQIENKRKTVAKSALVPETSIEQMGLFWRIQSRCFILTRLFTSVHCSNCRNGLQSISISLSALNCAKPVLNESSICSPILVNSRSDCSNSSDAGLPRKSQFAQQTFDARLSVLFSRFTPALPEARGVKKT